MGVLVLDWPFTIKALGGNCALDPNPGTAAGLQRLTELQLTHRRELQRHPYVTTPQK